MIERITTFLIMLLALFALARAVDAQAHDRGPPDDRGGIDDNDLAQVHVGLMADTPADPRMVHEPLRDVLLREGQFIAKVSELSREETKSLLREGEKALMLHGGRVMDDEIRFIGTRGVCVWDGGLMTFKEPPYRNARRILAVVLKHVSPDGREKFDAESERLEERRWRAAGLMQVAELDEALLLSSEQRERLSEVFSVQRRGVPRFPFNHRLTPLWNVRLPQKSLIAAGRLDGFEVPEAELTAVLQPWQLASYEKLRQTKLREVIIIEKATAGAKLRARRQAIDEFGMAHRFSAAERRRWLSEQLSRMVDDVVQSGALTEEQRNKLIGAGDLDILTKHERIRPEQSPDAEGPFREVARMHFSGPRFPPAIFDDAGSYFQKTLNQRLSDEQRQKVSAAWHQRREFQRKALVEAVVVGVERTAAITSAQCDELSRMLNEALAADEGRTAPPTLAEQGTTSDRRIESLRRIAQLPDETWRPLFYAFQWPAAKAAQSHLAEAARMIESITPAFGKIRVFDNDGKLIEFDVRKIDGIE